MVNTAMGSKENSVFMVWNHQRSCALSPYSILCGVNCMGENNLDKKKYKMQVSFKNNLRHTVGHVATNIGLH